MTGTATLETSANRPPLLNVADAARASRLAVRHSLLAILLAAAVVDCFFGAANHTETKHDLAFHASNVLDFQAAWQDGELYPRWAARCNHGLGAPNFVFYPPLAYALASFFGLLGCDLATSMRICIALLGLGRGLSLFGWLRSRGLDARVTTAAAIAYMALPYPLLNIFRRGALAETAAWIWFPLILWGCDELRQRCSLRFILAWAGLLFTHLLSMLMFAPVAATYFLGQSFSDNKQNVAKQLSRASLAVVLGTLLAAVFVLPAMSEIQHTAIPQENQKDGSFIGVFWGGSFLFDLGGHAPEWQRFNWMVSAAATIQLACGWLASSLLLADCSDSLWRSRLRWLLVILTTAIIPLAIPFAELCPSQIETAALRIWAAMACGAIALASGVVLALAVLDERTSSHAADAQERRFVRSLAVIVAISGLMMTPVSTWLWTHVPKLAAIQLPWRWTSVLTMATSVLVPLAVLRIWERRQLLAGATLPKSTAVILATAIVFAANLSMWFAATESKNLCLAETYETVQATGKHAIDYIPVAGYHHFVLTQPQFQGPGTLRSGAATIEVTRWRTHRRELTMNASEPTTVALHVFYFPGWQAALNGRPIPLAAEPTTGLALVNIPAGRHSLELRFRNTAPRQLGLVVSLGAFFVTMAMCGWRGRRLWLVDDSNHV